MVEVLAARVYVEERMRKMSVRPSLYMSEAADGRDTRGITITSLVEVGSGHSTGEPSSLT
jgi:hypothetical protein